MKPSAGALLSLRSSLVAAEPLGVDLVVGTVGADFVEDLVKTLKVVQNGHDTQVKMTF